MSGQPLTINENGLVTSIGEKPEPKSPQGEVQADGTETYMNGRITVVERLRDYMAYLDGNLGLWECGKTKAEAIGKLIMFKLPR